jgi:Molybdenum cofactor biosynthesis enzyme
MKIFDEEINFKNYDCSYDNNHYRIRGAMINLYVQATSKCNAKCCFCYTKNKCNNFNYEKFNKVLKELSNRNILKRIAITGGEPLLDELKTMKIIEEAKRYCEIISLNTNAYSIDKIDLVYDKVSFIDISKHHYDNNINNKIMGLQTPTIDEICNRISTKKIKVNCVLQNSGINSFEELKNMLNILSDKNISEVKFISILPLNQMAVNEFVNPENIMKQCEVYLNDSYLYDKHMCKCFEFMYVSDKGKVIKVTIRYTIDKNYDCVKQLVYDGEYLYTSFNKDKIII